MQQTGEYRIAAPRRAVWDALNDPDVLARCIPGCEAFETIEDGRFEARVHARIGPLNAVFRVDIALTNASPPARYTLTGAVKGGPVGFAAGSADVHLEEDDGDTRLRYEVHARTGGKLAQLASRLVDGALRKTANDFFSRFNDVVAAPADTDPSVSRTEDDEERP
jgi:uncharacterized protein